MSYFWIILLSLLSYINWYIGSGKGIAENKTPRFNMWASGFSGAAVFYHLMLILGI